MILLSIAVAAQAVEAPEIVVTGRGLAEARGESVYGSVALDRERLAGSASRRLDEVLKDVPGLQLFRRSDARSANPTSQGVTLRALGGNASSRTLLLLDGVPQTDPFGGWISWPAYDPRRLGEARITRGGGSGASGAGALAGTIELTSAGLEELEGASGEAFLGSRDSIDAFGGLGATIGGGFLSLTASYASGDGFTPVVEEDRGAVDRPAPYEQASVAARAVVPVGGAELQASGILFSDERSRGTPFSGISTTGADASLRVVGDRWTALAYVQTRDFYNSFASVADDRATASRASEQVSVPSTGVGARFEVRPTLGGVELRIGGDWRESAGETRERYSFQNGIGTRGRVAGGRTRTIGGFAEAAVEAGPLTLSGGGRIDRWWIMDGRLTERLFATGALLTETRFEHRSGWEPTARAGAAWRAAEAVTLRGAAYLGWRLPTLNELYRPFRAGADATAANAELAPERLRGIEAGVEFRPSPSARISATMFHNRLENGIANVTLGRGPGTFPGVGFVAGEYRQRQNIDAIRSRGIELDGEIRLGAVSLSAGYAFADAEVEADGAAAALDGLRPAQTPRHSASASVTWRSEGARLSTSARYVGSQYEDDLNQDLLPDALTFDAAASVRVAPGLWVETRGENLADERVVAGISADGVVERATPRTLWIGLRFGG